MILRTTPILLGLALAMPAVGQSHTDTILRTSGKHLTKLKITKLARDKITYEKGGKESTIDTLLVSGYRFGSAPELFTQGEAAANRGAYVNAAKLFGDVAKSNAPEVVKLAATFQSGRAFALAADEDATHANNAVAQLQAYISAQPDGYHIAEAKVRLAQASLASADAAGAAGAETMLTALEAEATTNSWALFWPAQIKFTKARAQFAQNKFAEARSSFQAVDSAVSTALGQSSAFNTELAHLKTEALVLQGETYIGEKAYADALSYYQSLANNTARGVKAAALAGAGQILYLQGADKKDVAKLRQAQLSLARACIEPDTSDSTSAKALYYTGMVLTALGDAEENALARAKTYFQSVKNNYGTTEWAAKARKALEG